MTPKSCEIDDVMNACAEAEESGGSRYPAMSYEQGVHAAILWMQGEGPNPMDD